MDGVLTPPPCRDENGLPCHAAHVVEEIPKPDPFKDKLKGKVDDFGTASKPFEDLSGKKSPPGDAPVTKELDMVPFAKLQVLYKLGDPLPEDISACVLDPVTEEKSLVKVSISYPFRPLFCQGCKSLGHSIGACPKVSRVWVQKGIKDNSGEVAKTNIDNVKIPGDVEGATGEHHPAPERIDGSHGPGEDGSWVDVKRKARAVSPGIEVSPSPPRTFCNLKNVDEIDKRKSESDSGPKNGSPRLTKSQKKKLRLQKGCDTPAPSS
ncbi:hypothetical protein ACET3Z_028188 [Daucus carota]